MDMDIGERIRREREEQGLSREDMAQALGKSLDMIGKLERGQRRISVKDLAQVATALGRSVEFFMDDAEEPEAERELEKFIGSAKLDARESAELRRIPRIQTKQAIVELVNRLEARRFGIFRQEIHEAEREVMPDGSCRAWWRRRIQVLDRELPSLNLRYVHNYDLRGTSLEGFCVKLLRERSSCEHRKMEAGNIHIQENVVFFSVLFDPPMQRGEIADVCCEEFYPYAYVMAREELQKLIRQNKFIEQVPKERTGETISVPTDFFRRRITFPEGYDVSDIDVGVFIARMRLHDECDRLRKEGCLTKMKVGSRWILELTVDRPVVGAAYQINWRPPAKAAYKNLQTRSRG